MAHGEDTPMKISSNVWIIFGIYPASTWRMLLQPEGVMVDT